MIINELLIIIIFAIIIGFLINSFPSLIVYFIAASILVFGFLSLIDKIIVEEG